jgi:hypothetical protein
MKSPRQANGITAIGVKGFIDQNPTRDWQWKKVIILL